MYVSSSDSINSVKQCVRCVFMYIMFTHLLLSVLSSLLTSLKGKYICSCILFTVCNKHNSCCWRVLLFHILHFILHIWLCLPDYLGLQATECIVIQLLPSQMGLLLVVSFIITLKFMRIILHEKNYMLTTLLEYKQYIIIFLIKFLNVKLQNGNRKIGNMTCNWILKK